MLQNFNPEILCTKTLWQSQETLKSLRTPRNSQRFATEEVQHDIVLSEKDDTEEKLVDVEDNSIASLSTEEQEETEETQEEALGG